MFNQKTQRNKGTKVFPDTKVTSDLKVATKPCGRGSPPNPPRGTCVADEKLCGLCKAALLLFVSSATEKKHSVFVSLCLKIKNSVPPCLCVQKIIKS